MQTANFLRRIPRRFKKTVTFDGGAGSGAVGTVAIATVTGSVLLNYLTARCLTNLAGATATVELGVAGNTAALIAQATATDIDAGKFWHDATPEVGVSNAVINKSLVGNVILTVATAAVSAGVLEIVMLWTPLSDDGDVA